MVEWWIRNKKFYLWLSLVPRPLAAVEKHLLCGCEMNQGVARERGYLWLCSGLNSFSVRFLEMYVPRV